MDRTALVSTEKKHEYPILIVDRKGVIGGELAEQLKNESLVVFVSGKAVQADENIIHIPFVKRIPTIPDNVYSHIFLVDEELELSPEILQSFLKKAKKDNSSLLLCVWYRNVSYEQINNFISFFEKAKVAIFGDVFAKNFIYNPHAIINKLITQIKKQNKILISADGMEEARPVYYEDLIFGVLEAMFGNNKEEKVFYIMVKHPITELSLAHIFQKIDPELKIDFSKENVVKKNNIQMPMEGKYILGENYSIQEGIKKLDFENILVGDGESKAAPVVKQKKESYLSFKILTIAVIFFLLLPLLSTLFFSTLGLGALNILKSNIAGSNVFSSVATAQVASKSFNLALSSSAVLYEESKLIGQEGLTRALINKINLGNDVSKAAVLLIDASNKFKNVFTGASKNPTEDFANASIDTKDALLIYNKEKEEKLLPQSITSDLSDIINFASSTIDLWPDMAGFNGARSYLVLFQNNMELRPGGGFIGSYAVLTLDKGKVVSFKINDVYDADGQLKDHVEPPFPIRRYLPSIHWYLRDSNFDVDFSKGAVASAVFLNTEMHQSVDGVIGVDLTFVKNILSAMGPVYVSDYKETVNSDNLFQVTQSHAQKDFFPGSTQKKDFLRSLFIAIQNKLSQKNNFSYINLLQMLSSSIYEKHALFAFNDLNEQAIFSVNGWASALIDERPVDDSRINDFLGISEANLGIDKVNYFITRSLSQSVTLQNDGSVLENLTVAFKNSAPKNSAGGVYKNYLRLILPLDAKITNIKIDNQVQKIVPAITDPTLYEKKGFLPPSGLEVYRQDEQKNSIYGFLILLQPQDLRTINVEYSLSQKLNMSRADFNYSVKFFKQPGIDFYPYEVELNYPQNLKAVDASDGVKISSGKALFSDQLTRDTEVNVHLAPK